MTELSHKQSIAICHLATGASNKEAADRAGISLSSLEKWKRNPTFKQELRKASLRLYDAAIAELMLGVEEAVRELKKIIEDPETPKRTKVSAIQVLLSHAERVRQWELEERLETVELKLDGNGAYAIEATKD